MGRVETAGVDTIHPDPRNVNTHPDEQLAQIAASIRDFGFNDPISVDQNGMIVEGHGRLEAARRLGMTEVPILRLTFASSEERRAYAIAHNQTQLVSRMDEGVVLAEVERIGVDTDAYQALGYTHDDIVFMQMEQSGAAADAMEEGAGARAAFRDNAAVTPLKFGSQERMNDWLTGLDWLREMYPDELSVGDRLLRFAAEYEGAL